MKRILTVLLAVLFLIAVFAGCGSENDETLSANGNDGTSHTQGEEQENAIILSEEITELTGGLSAVRHAGDYGFDEFLAGGRRFIRCRGRFIFNGKRDCRFWESVVRRQSFWV